jgi:hypothetical protein
MGLFPAGALLGGGLGSAIGARATLLASFVLVVVSVAPARRALRGARDIGDLPPWTA